LFSKCRGRFVTCPYGVTHFNVEIGYKEYKNSSHMLNLSDLLIEIAVYDEIGT
jgi:hypothetical protein